MELVNIIEMVAYKALHCDEGLTWRCVLCEDITKHSHNDVIDHMIQAHNLLKTNIIIDKDGAWLTNQTRTADH